MAAHLLTSLRLIVLPFLLHDLRHTREGCSLFTLFLLALAALSDISDGYVARRLGQDSDLGRILDPLADKIFLGALAVGLVLWREFPLWLLIMLIVRDLGIVLAGLFLLRARRLVIPANRFGKATTTCMGFTALAFIAGAPSPVEFLLSSASALLLVASGLSYALILRRLLRS